jgi:hypothetical protein
MHKHLPTLLFLLVTFALRAQQKFLDLFKECCEYFEKMSIYDIADFAISDFRLGVLK